MATYKVKKGDTLSAIAKQYGTTYQDIAKANGISNPNKIYVGQTLTIGSATPKTTTTKTTKTTTKPKTTTKTTTPTYTYEEFKPSKETITANNTRQEIASQKPSDFKYDPYAESDIVKQAYSMLQQHIANKPGEYQSNWQTQLNETLNKILNREDFTYDLNGDALYQQYKDQYMLQGQLAMMDTMGQAQAMTGGYGNSYAQSVGQQTYQGYLQQLNDKVPELYQLARDQYYQEEQALYNQYGLIMDRENQDYGRHRDDVSDYYTDLNYLTDTYNNEREFDYGTWFDNTNFEYGMHRDDVTDWQFDLNRADNEYWNLNDRDYTMHTDEQEILYQLSRDAIDDANTVKTQANETVMSMLSIGVMPSAQMLKNAGISSTDAKAIVNKVLADEAKVGTSGSGSSGSGSRSKGSNKGNTSGNTGGYDTHGYTKEQIKSLQRAAGITDDGIWGAQTEAAYQKGVRPEDDKPNADEYSDWDAGDWESYFAQIRQSEGKAAAEEELKYFTSNGLIPTKFVNYGAIGARGGSMGH
jgi:murein DD-endopeptidase MepM/ murein hydrolase activator NlpD